MLISELLDDSVQVVRSYDHMCHPLIRTPLQDEQENDLSVLHHVGYGRIFFPFLPAESSNF